MKRKLAFILCAVFTVIMSVFAFAACGDVSTGKDNPGITPGTPENPDNNNPDNNNPDDNDPDDKDPDNPEVPDTSVYRLIIPEKNIAISLGADAEHTANINASVTRDGQPYSDARVSYESRNTAVATVSDSGVVTAVAQGEAKINIRAEITGRNPLVDQVSVTVTTPPTLRDLTVSQKTVDGKPVDITASAVDGETDAVYSLSGGVVSFTAEQLAALDAKYTAGYTYLTFDIKFPAKVSEEIKMNLGGTNLVFRNNNVPTEGYYWGAGARGDNNTPKNFVDKDTTAVAFIIYDAEGGVVCNAGNNNKLSESQTYPMIGGVADGKMTAGSWFSVVVPLENRTKEFAVAESGLTLSGLNGCYIKNLKVQTGNPYDGEVIQLEGKLFEAKHTTSGSQWIDIERLAYYYPNEAGYPSWATAAGYFNEPVNIDNGNADSYDIAALLGSGKVAEPVNAAGCFAGQHFFQLDVVPEMLSQGVSVVRFDIVFNGKTNFTTAYSNHAISETEPYNFFAYMNGTWQYLSLSTSKNRARVWNGSGIAIYNEAGEMILDAWSAIGGGTGEVALGGKYTFEFNVSSGNSAKNHLLFCGVEDAVISNIVWSSKRLNEKATTETETEDVTNLTLTTPVTYNVVGTADSLNKAYNDGYTYIALPITLGATVPAELKISVYGTTVALNDFNQSSVAIVSADWSGLVNPSELVANTQYIILIALEEVLAGEETADFEANGLIELFEGFENVALTNPIAVNEDYAQLKALIESLGGEEETPAA